MKKLAFVMLSLFLASSVQAADPIRVGFLHTLSGGVGQVYGIPDQAG